MLFSESPVVRMCTQVTIDASCDICDTARTWASPFAARPGRETGALLICRYLIDIYSRLGEGARGSDRQLLRYYNNTCLVSACRPTPPDDFRKGRFSLLT